MLNKILKIAEANATIDSLKKQVASYQDQLKKGKTDLDDADKYGQELRGELAERDIEIKALEEELVKSKEQNKAISAQALDATAQAAEIVAGIGISEPIEAEDKKSKTHNEILDDFTAMTDPQEKMTFYKQHREQLLNLT